MATEIVMGKDSGTAMDRWAADQLVDWAAGKAGNKGTKAALRAEIDETAQKFAGPETSHVERVLAQTAALDWFALRLYETRYAFASDSDKGLTLPQSEFHQRRIDRTHRRLITTLKTLATVRRLAVPPVQINLARQQVNVSGSAS